MSGIFRHVPWHPRRPPRWLPTYTTADPVMGPPNVRVFLDDGTGTFPYDVSAWVRLVDGVTTSGYGRGDENTAVTSTQLTLTLDNSDGRFSLGAVGYGIAVDQKIRVKHNGVNRFTGYVQSWPVRWAPAGFQALTTISATDEWARLSRFTLRSMIEEEILLAGPAAYYTLRDPAGATAPSDASGNFAPALAQSSTGGNPVTFDGEAATFTASSEHLYADLESAVTGANMTLRVTVSITAAGPYGATLVKFAPVRSIFAYDRFFSIYVDASGVVCADVVKLGSTNTLTGISVTDGADHDAVLSFSVAGATLYVDGVSRDTDTSDSPAGGGRLTIGPTSTSTTVSMRHAAVFSSVLSSAQAGYQSNAINGSESSDARLSRIAAIVGSPTGSIAAGLSTLVYPDFAGSSAADVLNSIGEGEAGVVYVDGSGNLRFVNRNTRPLTLTAAFTADTATEIVGQDTEVVSDMSDVVNYATARRTGGSEQVARDQVSIDAHGRYPHDLTAWVATDDEALGRANWLVSKHAEPAPRIPQLTLDLMTASASVVAAALALDIGSRISLAHMPTQTPGTIGDLMVEGWTETVTDQAWTLEMNTTAWALQTAWILDSATYSLLDSTTLLGV